MTGSSVTVKDFLQVKMKLSVSAPRSLLLKGTHIYCMPGCRTILLLSQNRIPPTIHITPDRLSTAALHLDLLNKADSILPLHPSAGYHPFTPTTNPYHQPLPPLHCQRAAHPSQPSHSIPRLLLRESLHHERRILQVPLQVLANLQLRQVGVG